MSTTKRALMKPIPTLAVALKWVASTTSIFSTPGPHWPTCWGSTTNAHTRSRGARIGTVPSKRIGRLQRYEVRSGSVRRCDRRRQVGGRFADEAGPAAHGTERIDDALVLRQMPGVRA